MSNFYNLTIEESLEKLKTNSDGLSLKEAEKRIEQYGKNQLQEEDKISKLKILFEQFNSPLIYILIVAGLISLILKEFVDAGVIFGSVILNTIIGFIQENKANESISKLKKMVQYKALVLRNGHQFEINSHELTIGDVLILKPGHNISADARLIEVDNLEVNEASLTGESVPVHKLTERKSKGTTLAERANMVYAGTVITRGRGKAVVTAIANQTEIGKIANLVGSTKEEKTPLQLRLGNLSKMIGVVVGVICLLIIILGLTHERDFFEIFLVSIAVAVAAIPEGLVVAVTVILVLGMQQILRQKALTRKLVAAETLGSTTVICTDKTGTLTEGEMSVDHIVFYKENFKVNKENLKNNKNSLDSISQALKVSLMCNDAVIENLEAGLEKWKIIGEPTEKALLSAATQFGLDHDKITKSEVRVGEVSFNSERKFMATLHQKSKDSYVLYEKGAAEKLLAKSSYFYKEGEFIKLDDKYQQKLLEIYEDLTYKGLRVIGLAYRDILKNNNSELFTDITEHKLDWKLIDDDLKFIGFVALKDPLRKEARETIMECQRAGIRPVIVTGDHKLTAQAIGAEIGLKVNKDNIVIGELLEEMTDEELRERVRDIDIYARVSPHHKLRIIKAWQEIGEVVAMTGDGINDSPALKAADIGVSLGNGTDIAKETSDIILLDNNFKTIVAAVRQGRVIFSNIRKVVLYLISDSFCEVILIAGALFLNAPLPILPVQILWINIVNDGLPDFALAFEKGDPDIMRDKPIPKNARIINKEMFVIIFAVGLIRDLFLFGIFFYFFKNEFKIEYIRTIIFAATGFDSLLYIFSIRSFRRLIWQTNPFSNLYLVGAVFISMSLLLLAIYLPPLQIVLSTVPLGFNSWFLIISTGILTILMIEMVKYYFIINKKDTLNCESK